MTDKILNYMEEYHMLPENGNIVVGVSGGADSVCLLYALVRLRDGWNAEGAGAPAYNLTAVHVNHGLREEAEDDAAFVEVLCHRWRVPFVLVKENVEKLAKERRLSCEEAGRMVRYSAFERTLCRMDESGGGRGCIAVAHNSDDRAETFLFHLLRGTGLAGMGSIRPVRENADGSRIIRPLLFASRQEIEAFLKKEGLSWRTDRTNAEELYTRNKLRNRVLPYAEKEICGQAREHLAREAALLAETADFVAARTQEALVRCAAEDEKGELRFETDAFLKEEPFLQDQMLLCAMGRIGCQRDLTAAHVAEVKKLFAGSCTSGKRVVLPLLGISARRQFQQVILKKISGAGEEKPEAGAEVPVTPGTFYVPGLGRVTARLLTAPDGDATFFKNIPEKKYTKWLDYDKIMKSAMFRTRCTGDYLTIDDALHTKSLKRYMIEERIPAHERDGLMLLADGAHVIWVPGHRISAAYKVNAGTVTILELCCEPDGGTAEA